MRPQSWGLDRGFRGRYVMCGLLMLGVTSYGRANPPPRASDAAAPVPSSAAAQFKASSTPMEISGEKAGDDAFRNPQSAAFLSAFEAPRRQPIMAYSGSTIHLWEKMVVAEYPDYDPGFDLDKISVTWEQVSGPAVRVTDPGKAAASVRLPEVDRPTSIQLRVVLKNASGGRTLDLVLEVRPKP